MIKDLTILSFWLFVFIGYPGTLPRGNSGVQDPSTLELYHLEQVFPRLLQKRKRETRELCKVITRSGVWHVYSYFID